MVQYTGVSYYVKLNYIHLMNKRNAQNISDKVAKLLFEECARQGVTKYRVAKETGLSQSTLANIQNGVQKPTLYVLIMIASYLNVRLSDFLQKENQ